MAKTWIWISGWAIEPERFQAAVEQALHEDSHKVIPPTPKALEKVIASDTDFIGSYSLGGLILLSGIKQIPETAKIVCLAPFIAFCKEDQLGGTTPRATLRALQQRLRKQPQKTLKLFYRLAGLEDTLPTDLPYSIEHLEWGLEQLANLQADRTALSRVKTIAGLKDPLLAVNQIRPEWPNCYFSDECNHDYRQLLVALSSLRYF